MRLTLSPDVEPCRILDGHYATLPGKREGAFQFKGPLGRLLVISSGVDARHGWEHVSVSARDRCPTWDEMCWVKDIFWHENETVIQYHPPKAEYVNCHPHCLHLWKPLKHALPLPPSILVGPKSAIAK